VIIMPPEKPRRLGRGLEALLSGHASSTEIAADDRSALRSIPVSRIRPNPYQPRKEFNAQELAELQASLRENGLLSPIAVRSAPSGGGFELIAGERRLRAATNLGWAEIPAVVKEIDDRALLTLALVENLQRADLNPIEEAEGYRQLMRDFSLTQAEVAEVTGKERSTVANILRLLQLPDSVRKMVHARQLTLGHARALLTLDDEKRLVALAHEIVAEGLSVRDVERRVRDGAPARTRAAKKSATKTGQRGDIAIKQAQEELRRFFQTDVHVSESAAGRGKIEISYYSTEDLERLIDLILGARRIAL
jgi:ParB family chromosome partitioning protein